MMPRLRYIPSMRCWSKFLFVLLLFVSLLPLAGSSHIHITPAQNESRSFLGYDRNEYPGDQALPVLRKTFSFTSYWIGPPPGEKKSTWLGKRPLLAERGFGFVVLFNGRESRTLESTADARQKGTLDAQTAARSAAEEGFPKGTVIFVDLEEGGRLSAVVHEYLRNWFEGVERAGFRPGVYCSAIPVNEGNGASITTAQDIKDHAGAREIIYWVFNDACPPSPGCTFPGGTPSATQSGFSLATIWQYAQSPQRKERTKQCPATYAADGNCYAPGDSAHKWFIDADVATSADPSEAR